MCHESLHKRSVNLSWDLDVLNEYLEKNLKYEFLSSVLKENNMISARLDNPKIDCMKKVKQVGNWVFLKWN